MAICGPNESGTGGLAAGHLIVAPGTTNNSIRVFFIMGRVRLGWIFMQY